MGDDLHRLENAIADRARRLLAAVDRQETQMSIGSDWEDKLLDWAMSDPDRKCRILQFIDSFPALSTASDVVGHLKASFPSSNDRLPLALRTGLNLTGGLLTSHAVAAAARLLMRTMARRFIGGETSAEVSETVRRLKSEGFESSIDFLGEDTVSESEADRTLKTILSAMEFLPEESNFSVKLSSLTSFVDPVDPDEIFRHLAPRFRTVLRGARLRRSFVHIDGESFESCDALLDITLTILAEPEFRDGPSAGVVVQAYLRDAAERLDRVSTWCGRASRRLVVRLVKGAYWDTEVIRARRQGWTPPVYVRKFESDAAFERLALSILKHSDRLTLAVASHNLRSIAAPLVVAKELGVPNDRIEFQFLYGMARATRRVLADEGFRVRVYTPYGLLIPGMAYLVRRLLENSSNQSFLRHRRLGSLPAEDLLKSPHDSPPRPEGVATCPTAFQNTAAAEFHKKGVRESMRAAVKRCLQSTPERIGPVVNGRRISSASKMTSVNPSHPSQILADVDLADAAIVQEAVSAARRSWPNWRILRATDRAEILRRAAGSLINRRDDLAALVVCEAGKPWGEAQADVAEAVDFLKYYASEAERLAEGIRLQPEIPGEINIASVHPRGLAAVISPWNFPLAIPTGQIAAALATGNCVLFKPAEQTPLIAFRLFECLQDAGLPPGVLQFLPGLGEVAGAALVDHPDVDIIAFTGSRAVGEQILRQAASSPGPSGPKRVVAEMGGKNAVIIDSDADLDLAVRDCLSSAFDYAGQKCSALSRLILIENIFDAFVRRFAQAAADYPMGFAEIPSTRISPLIDKDAVTKVRNAMDAAGQGGHWILPPDWARVDRLAEGFFVPPAVVAVSDRHPAAREEIFGPLVAVLSCRSLDEAIQLANGTAYALTGGIFSRHPGHIDRVRAEFDVGNLYINRPITGAVVGRQPFGGHRSSGVGSKAGGPDYLPQFCVPVTVSENLSRHGYSPDVSV